jgi:hypothetical protein
MIVADVVNTVSGEEIENPPSVVGEQLHAHAALIADVHLQQVEQAYPLAVHSAGVAL